jgi:biotin carboxyl carrier protein
VTVYRVKTGGKEYEVTVRDTPGGGAEVTVDGQTFHVDAAGDGSAASATNRPPTPAPVLAQVDAQVNAPVPAPATLPIRAAATAGSTAEPAAHAPARSGAGAVVAPLPGVVTRILVAVGDRVEAGQVVLKLEAMKMENDISTAVAGTVRNVEVADGAEVSDGQLLMVVE